MHMLHSTVQCTSQTIYCGHRQAHHLAYCALAPAKHVAAPRSASIAWGCCVLKSFDQGMLRRGLAGGLWQLQQAACGTARAAAQDTVCYAGGASTTSWPAQQQRTAAAWRWLAQGSGARRGTAPSANKQFITQPTQSSAKPAVAQQQQAAPAAATAPLSPYAKWRQAFDSAPVTARVLGFAGAIPFIALAPPVAHKLYAVLPLDVIDNCAVFQVGYGACILSFLGAVHWGMAMGSTLTGPIAMRIANERYLWGVIPSLLAWPTVAMQPAPASMLLSVLLPMAWLWDARAARLGYLPAWYMSLRTPLTLLATYGMLLTASYYVHEEYDRLDKMAAKQEAAGQQQ